MPTPSTGQRAAEESETRPNIGMRFAFAFRALADRHAQLLDEAGSGWLKPSHAYVLHAVAATPQSIKQLAEMMQVTKQAMSQLVDLLEERGLVARAINDRDRRARDIAITPAGTALLGVAEKAWRAVEDEMSDLVGDQRFTALLGALDAYLAAQPESGEPRRARPVW